MTALHLPTDLSPTPVDSAGPADLRELLLAFTRTTQSLEATHAALQGQVARLQNDLAQANAALRRSEALAALGQMAAGIAHEVRNPLGSIQLYAQMLREDLEGNSAQAELCIKIDRAVTGLDAVVRDVLTFAREMHVRVEETTDIDLFDRAVSTCEGLIVAHQVTVRRAERGMIAFDADPALLTQALSNLVRNAVEAMVEHSCDRRELLLGAARRRVRGPNGNTQPCAVLWVHDSGPGIPENVRDRIFNPFFTTRHAGTGLGLAIVHRIVDAHGGHVRIGPSGVGGACVEICLPTTSRPQTLFKQTLHDRPEAGLPCSTSRRSPSVHSTRKHSEPAR